MLNKPFHTATWFHLANAHNLPGPLESSFASIFLLKN